MDDNQPCKVASEALEDPTDYQAMGGQAGKEVRTINENRFVPIGERQDTGLLSLDVMAAITRGKECLTFWRGVSLMKDPFDMSIYQQLFWELKPQTVIEFGAYKGGSALWTADMLKMFGCKSRVISIDIDLSLLDPEARKSPDVEFIEGDVFQLEKHFPAEFLKDLPHPWILMEDSHVNIAGVLEYFDKFTEPGDYICVEDTNPLPYSWGLKKMNKVRKFLMSRCDKYLVDKRYTDMYGYNATWNMNGYLKRV